jgi:hypothetical protein
LNETVLPAKPPELDASYRYTSTFMHVHVY